MPNMSSILKVDLLGGLIHLISSFLNWESVVTVRIGTEARSTLECNMGRMCYQISVFEYEIV